MARKAASTTKFNLRDARVLAREDLAASDSGLPRARFRKEIVRAGVYHKPGARIEIGPERVAHWRKTFDRMKSAGVKVPLVNEHSDDPKDGRGYIEEVAVDGDSLVAVVEAIGADAIEQCERNEVSIGLADISAGNGEKFGDAIKHVALTLHPVVGGMNPWQRLSKVTDTAEFSNGDANMEIMKKIAALLGVTVTDDMSEDQVLAAITAWAESNAKKSAAAPGTAAAAGAPAGGASPGTAGPGASGGGMSRREQELTAELARVTAKATPPEIDEDALEMMGRATLSRLDALVPGKISPAVRNKLAPVLVGKPGERPALALSRKAASFAGLPEPLAETILSALELNEPAKPGEAGWHKGRAMSRDVPGQEPPDNSAALIEAQIKANHAQYASSR